jgi:hypothetical protein
MHSEGWTDDHGALEKEEVMTRLATIFAWSALLAVPAIAEADQHAAPHPAPAAAAPPAGQMPMAGSPMMNGDMAAHLKAMHAPRGMMAKGGMHAGKRACPHHKMHGRHRHCSMHRK